jgi:protease-4
LRFLLITLLLIVAGVAAGFGVFNVGLGGDPKIAVMDGTLDVIDDELTAAIKIKMRFVADNDDVKAVVVRINSPGGSASASEEL